MYKDLVRRLRNCATGATACKTCDLKEDGSCSDILMKHAADAIEDLEAQLMYSNDAAKAIAEKVPKWIPVTERLPNVGEIVIVYTTKSSVSGRRVFLDAMITSTKTDIPFWAANNGRVTYWMPLPEPPTEEV